MNVIIMIGLNMAKCRAGKRRRSDLLEPLTPLSDRARVRTRTTVRNSPSISILLRR